MLAEVIIFLILYTVLIFTDLVPVYKAKKKKDHYILHQRSFNCFCIAISHYF